MAQRDREIIKKLWLLGDASSQKTELIRPLVWSLAPDKYTTTIGFQVTKKTLAFDITVDGQPVQIRNTLLLWDIVGQKQYMKLHPGYYQGAEGALVFCRVGGPEAVESVAERIRTFREVVGPVPIAIVVNCGTRSELEGTEPEAVGATLAELELPVFLTSLETPERTEEAIVHLAERMTADYVQRQGLPAEGGLVRAKPRERKSRRWFGRRLAQKAERHERRKPLG